MQQGIAYYVNFEQDDRDLFLYVGMPGENDTATLLVADDDDVDEDEDEEEELICLNEEEDEAKRRAPLQVFFAKFGFDSPGGLLLPIFCSFCEVKMANRAVDQVFVCIK